MISSNPGRPSSRLSALMIFFVLCLALPALSPLSQPQTVAAAHTLQLRDDMWVPNGTVFSTARSDNTLYIAGNFSMVGPPTGGFVKLDPTSTEYSATGPRVLGMVRTSIPDGSGGWYIGGQFSYVNGVARRNLAHIHSDDTLDLTWNPGTESTGAVFALARIGGTVYAGGSFQTVGGQNRSNLAALDGTSGAVTSWAPDPDSSVHALLGSGTTLYAGGGFYNIGGAVRPSLAALDTTAGSNMATSWAPSPDANVYTLQMSGTTLYAGGFFSMVGGKSRNYLAALDTTKVISSEAVLDWAPQPDFYVWNMLLNNTTLYIGGAFSNVSGKSRPYLAALDTTKAIASEAVLDWNPQPSGMVMGMAVNGTTLYVGGSFKQIAGQDRFYLAALDTSSTTNYVLSWTPRAGDQVRTLSLRGSDLYAGGDFVNFNGVSRGSIAAINLLTGRPTDWNPNANTSITAILLDGTTLYAAGNFISIGGKSRNYLAALDTSIDTNNATDWNPSPDNNTTSLAMSGTTLYVGGNFQTIGGKSRLHLAALDTTKTISAETVLDWAPNPTGPINRMDISGSTLYAAGSFTTIGGKKRSRLAALDITAPISMTTAWDPSLDPNGTIYDLEVSGTTVYIGGYFSSVGVTTRTNLAALDTTKTISTETLLDWSADTDMFGTVFALEPYGTQLYVGGNIQSVGGVSRTNLALLDTTANTNNVLAWSPVPGGHIYEIERMGSMLFVGGPFIGIEGQTNSKAAIFVEHGAPDVITDAATGLGLTSATLNGSVYPNLAQSTISFQWGTTPGGPYPNSVAGSPSSVEGAIPITSSATLSNLQIGTSYYYRVVATNAEGTSYGEEQQLTTLKISSVEILEPVNGASVEEDTQVTIGGSAADSYGLQSVAVLVNGVQIDSFSYGASVTETLWSTDWTPATPGTYAITATMTNQQNESVSDGISVTVLPPSTPGGISSDLNLWLKADDGIASPSDNVAVPSWADQSGNGLDLSQATASNQPLYKASAANFNPALSFDSVDYLDRSSVLGSELFSSDQATIFSLKKSTSSSGVWFKWGTSATTRVGFELSAGVPRFDMPNDSSGRLAGLSTVNGSYHLVTGLKDPTSQYLYLDGLQDASKLNSNTLATATSSSLAIGKNAGGGLSWTGEIGEVIVYGRALSAAERERVESYLALKYGLTLGSSGSPVSYVNSNGTTIWDNADPSYNLYHYDIAGIGRDVASGLAQYKSRSSNGDDILTVAHGNALANPSAIANDRSFLIWGNDNGSTTSVLTETLGGEPFSRLARVWRFAKSGTLGATSASFDLNGLGVDYNAGELALLIDDDGDFSDASVHTTGRSVVGGVASFSNLSLADGSYLALVLERAGEVVSVYKAGNGAGSVTSAPAGISCGSTCSEQFNDGATVTLSATASTGSSFAGWSGDCSGSGISCSLTIDAAKSVTATFTLNEYNLGVTKTGNGTVTSSPAGINCGSDCSETLSYGSVITLTASAATGYTFIGWSGSCSGSALCVVTVDNVENVVATFSINRYTLTVSKAGSGDGTITSSPSGINCGSDCQESLNYGTVITLTASATSGSAFTGWSDAACPGTGVCVLTMSQARSVTASFGQGYLLSVSKAGSGSGSVTSSPAGINCGVDCSEALDAGEVITLTAVATVGSTFTGWSGDCSGSDPCVLTMSQARSVTANFSINQYLLSVSKAGNGSGTVTSSPSGINCGSDCSETLNHGSVITLTASATSGSVFTGWSGECSGTGLCVVTMSQARSVTATFAGSHLLSVVLAGSGDGTVTSSPAGISCGVDCSELFDVNTVITLTAVANTGSKFAGWSDGCSFSLGATCQVTLSQAKTITATFTSHTRYLPLLRR